MTRVLGSVDLPPLSIHNSAPRFRTSKHSHTHTHPHTHAHTHTLLYSPEFSNLIKHACFASSSPLPKPTILPYSPQKFLLMWRRNLETAPCISPLKPVDGIPPWSSKWVSKELAESCSSSTGKEHFVRSGYKQKTVQYEILFQYLLSHVLSSYSPLDYPRNVKR